MWWSVSWPARRHDGGSGQGGRPWRGRRTWGGLPRAGPGWTDAAIATALEVGRATVARVRQRYVAEGLEAALAHKAPDREYERTLDGAQEAHLLALACSAPPAGGPRPSPR